MDITNKLKNLPFFAQLSDDELGFLNHYLYEHTFAAGQVILRQGARGGDLYLIKSGIVSVCVTLPGDTQREAARLHDGHIFGEVAFLASDPITAGVTAIETSVCIVFYHQVMKMLRIAFPDMAFKIEQAIARQTSDKLISNINRILTLLNRIPAVSEQLLHTVKLPIANSQYRDIDIYSLREELIHRIGFFKDLKQQETDLIIELMRARVYDKGYEFKHQDESSRKIALVYSGAVMLFIKEQQHLRKSIAVMGFGSLFLQCFFTQELNQCASYVTCEQSILLELDYELYERLRDTNPSCFYAISHFIHSTIAASVYIVNRQFIRMTCEYSDLMR